MKPAILLNRSFFRLAAAAGAMAALSGCMGQHSQMALDEIQGAVQGAHGAATPAPFVEAFVEYPGPSSRWAGAETYVVHLDARQAGPAALILTPSKMSPGNDPTTAAPRLSAFTPLGMGAVTHTTRAARAPANALYFGRDGARLRIAELSEAIQQSEEPYSGCLTPVQVRLIREDGALVSKKGCRSQMGWSRTVSAWVNDVVAAAVPATGPIQTETHLLGETPATDSGREPASTSR